MKKNPQRKYKQVIVLRKDLKMPAGKAVVQGAHASEKALYFCSSHIVTEWRKEYHYKCVLAINSEKELMELRDKADKGGIPYAVITDLGLTVFKEPTVTALGLGPAKEEDLNKITGHLKLY